MNYCLNKIMHFSVYPEDMLTTDDLNEENLHNTLQYFCEYCLNGLWVYEFNEETHKITFYNLHLEKDKNDYEFKKKVS